MKKLWICLAGLLVSACFTGVSQTSDFYYLTAQKPENKTFNTVTSINIENVRIPASIDKPQIITTDPDGIQIQIHEFHRWIEPLDSMIAKTVAQDMALIMPKSTIKNGADVFETFNYTVSIDIVQFWGTLEGQTTLDAWWRVRNKEDKTIFSGHTLLTAPSGKTIADLVKTQSHLLTEMSDQIAQKILKK
ncbi:MAG: membrane integrity-associated transporter subunit PqiC [Alphaproteobacteria bacterium]|nr:membrane integrity-associated transporter subunit PqiC [Alphaproteobacteria bacterium]